MYEITITSDVTDLNRYVITMRNDNSNIINVQNWDSDQLLRYINLLVGINRLEQNQRDKETEKAA